MYGENAVGALVDDPKWQSSTIPSGSSELPRSRAFVARRLHVQRALLEVSNLRYWRFLIGSPRFAQYCAKPPRYRSRSCCHQMRETRYFGMSSAVPKRPSSTRQQRQPSTHHSSEPTTLRIDMARTKNVNSDSAALLVHDPTTSERTYRGLHPYKERGCLRDS